MEAASHIPELNDAKEVNPASESIFKGFILNSAIEIMLPTKTEAILPDGITTQTSAVVLNLDSDSPQGFWHDF